MASATVPPEGTAGLQCVMQVKRQRSTLSSKVAGFYTKEKLQHKAKTGKKDANVS